MNFWRSLTGRLFKLVFGGYLVLAIAVTAVQLALEYSSISRGIHGDLESLGQSFAPSVSDALWSYDRLQLDTMARGILQTSFVTGVRIESVRGDAVAQAGAIPADGDEPEGGLLAPYQRARFPLSIATPRGVQKPVGQLMLYSDRSVVIERIEYSFVVILTNSLIKTAGLWLIFYLVITRSLAKPLADLTDVVSRVEFAADSAEPISFDYPYKDELGRLLAAMRKMQERVAAARQEVLEVNRHLEETVALRTQALREDEEKQRGLFQLSPLGIALTDMTGRYIEFNEAFRAICGYSADELMRLNYWALTPKKYEADEARHQESLQRTGRYGPYEKEYRRQDGTLIPLRLNGMLVTGADGQRYIWSIVEDITESKQAEQALVESESRFRHLFENNGSAMMLIDADSGTIIDANQAASAFYGYSLAQLKSMSISAINTLPAEEIARERQRAMREERNYFNFPHRLASGEVRNVEVYSTPTEVGGRRLLLSVIHDITERKKVESRLRLAAAAFANSREGIVITNADNVIVDANPGFSEITGYSREETIGRNPGFLSSGCHGPEFYAEMWSSLRELDFWRGEIWNRRKDGGTYAEMLSISAVRDDEGMLQYYIGIFSDISHLKEHEAELNRIAYYDALTGVPNRRLFLDRLGQAIALTQRNGKALAVCYLDLDDFKPVNDRYGHRAGDHLLIEITERVRGLLRANDTIARLGGDEFVLLLTELSRQEECCFVLDRILSAVSSPVSVEGNSVCVSASIGVALSPPDEPNAEVLMRHADAAMYLAKTAGKNRYHLFSSVTGTPT